MTSFENILFENNEGILTITINRPSKLNALNKQTISELSQLLDQVKEDSTVYVVVITGAGEKSFVAGADISEFQSFSKEEGKQLGADGQKLLFDKVHHFPKPVIARVNGFALGGGLELAMACHLRVASDNAKLGLPEVTLGLIPGYGGTQRLTQLIGRGRAMEMILTGDMIDANTAASFGLVNYVVTYDELDERVNKLAGRMASRSGIAQSAAINAVNASLEADKNGYEVEIDEFGKCFGTPDFKEGVDAFLNKRKPNFRK